MKTFVYLLACVVLIGACKDDDVIMPMPEVPGPPTVDSVHLTAVDLRWPGGPDRYAIGDFTAQIPGYVWGCVADLENQSSNKLFSYHVATGLVEVLTAPAEIKLPAFTNIEAGPDGKLYVHSSGYLSKSVAIYDTRDGAWSSIQVPGLVNGFAIDPVTNSLWIAHGEGVSRLKDDTLTTYDETNSGPRRTTSGSNYSFSGFQIAVDRAGNVWYANGTELFTFSNDEWSLHPLSPLSNRYIITHVVSIDSGGVLVKVPEEALVVLDTESKILDYGNVRNLATSSDIAIDIAQRTVDNNIIVSHFDGFSFYTPSRDSVTVVNSKNSIIPTGNTLYALSKDEFGNVWFGGYRTLIKLPNDW